MSRSSETDNLTKPDAETLTYDRYLKVQQILNLQQPLADPPAPDEMLFIIIHQVYELWFKEILHELEYGIGRLKANQPMACLRHLNRIHAIQDVLTTQVDVLETMTPVDFNRFRERLNPASGFQSFQFRILEYKLGQKNPSYLKYHEHEPEIYRTLENALEEPTLYDHFLHYVASRGHSISKDVLNRDYSKLHSSDDSVKEAFLNIYRNADDHYDLYLALEALMDLDQKMLLWRYRHIAMVERMIGSLRGTGGSSGVQYLSTTLSKKFFPEIWDIRNAMGRPGKSYERKHHDL